MHSRLILTVTVFLMLLMAGSSLAASQQNFRLWLANLRREALATGISRVTLDNALKDLELLPRVIELDRGQPELRLTLPEYLNRMVNERRVARGRTELVRHRTLLKEILHRYAVQPEFLVALWGIETNFGRLKGNFPVIGATATLAYRGRRRSFFRRELLCALHILDQGHISTDRMKGSWAGAMGQFQWMPSSFQKFAVDYEGDGRVDVWNNLADAFASAANYLSQSDWVKGQTWGHEAFLPPGFDRTLVGLGTRKPLTEWRVLSVRAVEGRPLRKGPAMRASVIEPDGPDGRAFLVYENYCALLDWNHSHLFAIAVGTLADRIMRR